MSNASWIGQSLNGRYKIEELIGQGGMSAVYKATDPNLRRVVAVKMIHAHLSSNPDFLRRFEEEATAVAQLRHPNIVQVFDFNHDGDTFYMVLEFIPGETLQDRLKRLNARDRRLPLDDALAYIIEIADAIQYAHERGMIHRDIKPANIMLDVYGKAILMDFGIARILGGQTHTATGAVIGTAMYMSPEQIVGERVDERSDIYSLGVTLFETISGRPPFEADSAMTLMMMHMNDPVPDIRELQPQAPDDLVAVIGKALEKKRDRRYQSAAAMAAALRTVQARLKSETAQPAAPRPVESTQVEPPLPASTQVETPAPQIPKGAATFVEKDARPAAAPVVANVEPTPPPSPEPAGRGAAAERPGKRAARTASLPVLLGAGAIGLVALVALAILGSRLVFGASGHGTATPSGSAAAAISPTAMQVAALLTADTPSPEPTATPAVIGTSFDNPQAVAPTPTPTVPAGDYVRIDQITIRNGQYVVDFETFNFTPKLTSTHIHFFFNTVPQNQAGMPGSGPWELYAGASPFTKYGVNDKPAAATQLCTLVANADHTVKPNSGNCVDLPAQ